MKLRIFGVKWYWYLVILVIVLVILLILFRSLKLGANSKKNEGTQYLKDVKKLLKLIRKVDSDLDPDTQLMIAAQSLFETGGLGHDTESPVLERNNNLFGMKEAQTRDRDQLGDIDGDGYSNYKDWEQSIRDHKLWLEANGMYHYWIVPDMYVEALKKKNYFEASLFQYKRGLLFYYEGLKKIPDL